MKWYWILILIVYYGLGIWGMIKAGLAWEGEISIGYIVISMFCAIGMPLCWIVFWIGASDDTSRWWVKPIYKKKN